MPLATVVASSVIIVRAGGSWDLRAAKRRRNGNNLGGNAQTGERLLSWRVLTAFAGIL